VDNYPKGLDVDTAGNVYVALRDDNQVAKYKPVTGSFELETTFNGTGRIGRADKAPGGGNGELSYPEDVAVTPDGQEIAVVDAGNERVQRFTKDGAFIGYLEAYDPVYPQGRINYDENGILYIPIPRNGTSRLVAARPPYVIADSIVSVATAQSIATTSRGVYVSDVGQLYKFSPVHLIGHASSDRFISLGTISILPTQPASFYPRSVSAISLASEERIYIAEELNNRVIVLKVPVMPTDGPETAWDTLKQRLLAGDTAGALSFFASDSVDSYRNQFAILGISRVAQAMNEIGQILPISVNADTAQYRFVNTIDGLEFTFLIRFVKENGTWKIVEF